MKGYIETLTEYADSILTSDFPPQFVDSDARYLAGRLVLGMFGNAAERAAGKYTGFGSFGNAVKDGDWMEAAFRADSGNLPILGNWMRFTHWLTRKDEELRGSAVVAADGIRYLED